MSTGYLIDTSALARIVGRTEVRERWTDVIGAGLVSYCDVTELEFVRSARSSADRDAIRSLLRDTLAWCAMPDRVFSHARQIQDRLVDVGKHRGPGPVDLLVAATADLTGQSLLHYDADFESVAAVTRQATRWVAPRGTID